MTSPREYVRCADCENPVIGEAVVDCGFDVLHPRCSDARARRRQDREKAERGLPHRCPNCDGAGALTVDHDNSAEMYNGGYAVAPRSSTERRSCELCKGVGFLAKKPREVVEKRWVR